MAKTLFQQGMQEEGYTSVSQIPPITMTYSSGGVQASRDEVAAMQQMWQTALGISVKTNDIDINTLFTDEGRVPTILCRSTLVLPGSLTTPIPRTGQHFSSHLALPRTE